MCRAENTIWIRINVFCRPWSKAGRKILQTSVNRMGLLLNEIIRTLMVLNRRLESTKVSRLQANEYFSQTEITDGSLVNTK